jgi:DNA-binding SARP family transcriptional activator/predicted Zn-dependent protease
MLHLRTFGGLALQRDGTALDLVNAQRKALALLAVLASAGTRGIGRDKLMLLLWPESDADRARGSLKQMLHTLRRQLGSADAILGTAELRLDPELIESDLTRFRAALEAGELEAAVALYHGPFLDGVHLAGAPEFDGWLEQQRAELERGYREALERLACAAEAAGELERAAAWWRRLQAADPLNGRVALRLMQALEASGDRAAALRHASVHEALLREELGIEPEPAVTALAERLVGRPAEPSALPMHGNGYHPGLLTEIDSTDETARQPSGRVPAASRQRVPPGSSDPAGMGTGARRWHGLAWAGALLLLAGVAGALLFLRPAPSLSRERVFVATLENQTGDAALDPLGRMAADWLTQGLARAGVAEVVPTITPFGPPAGVSAGSPQPDVGEHVIAHARQARAGTVVWGAYYLQGDSVFVQAHVTDVQTGRVMGWIPTVGGRADRPLEVVEDLRRKVIAALAARFDRTVASLAEVSSQPPSFEAYREYTQGVEHFLRSEYPVGLAHFDRAVALDSSFTMAAIWGVFARLNLGLHVQADSITQRLIPLREQLPPFDQTMLDALRATFAGDLPAQARATRAGAELAPGSFGQYAAAFYALRINRPREAVELLAGVDPDRADHRGWIWYWDVLTSAHHMLGEHREELHAAREARKRYPDRLQAVVWEARALAALGRVAEMEGALIESLQPFSGPASGTALRQVAEELRAHGHSAAAERMLERTVATYERLPAEDLASAGVRFGFAEALYRSGRYGEAREIFETLAAEDPARLDYLGYLGVIAAREGHPHEAERITAQLASLDRLYLFGLNTFWRARIAALLGHDQDAVRLLQAAFAEGRPYSTAWHSEPDFERLRSDPAFRRFLRPAG